MCTFHEVTQKTILYLKPTKLIHTVQLYSFTISLVGIAKDQVNRGGASSPKLYCALLHMELTRTDIIDEIYCKRGEKHFLLCFILLEVSRSVSLNVLEKAITTHHLYSNSSEGNCSS